MVQRVLPGSAADGRARRGDVIVEVNRVAVGRAADAIKQMGATPAGQPDLMKVKREGKTRFVAIERRLRIGRVRLASRCALSVESRRAHHSLRAAGHYPRR